MKRLLVTVLSAIMFQAAMSAQMIAPLFDDFEKATVHMNKSKIVVPMNYDRGNDKMYYKDRGTIMELSLDNKIDSIVWAGKHSFVLMNGKFCEKIKLSGKPVLVQWKLKKVSIGKSGALGANTQSGNITEMNLAGMGMYGAGATGSVENYKYTNTNVYFVHTESGTKRIASMKNLYKCFPEKAEAAKIFAKNTNLVLSDHEDFMQLLAYCLRD